MKAILLAGGKGTRLRPLTIHTPKPIVPIFDRPFLHYQLDLLKQVPEIDEVILSLNYQPRRIEEIFGDGGDTGLEHPLRRRAGAARHRRRGPLRRRVAARIGRGVQRRRADAGRSRRGHRAAPRAQGQGDDRADAGRQPDAPTAWSRPTPTATSSASSRSRTPTRSPATRSTPASTCSSPTPSTAFPKDTPWSIERSFFPSLIERGETFVAYVYRGYWIDIGTPEKYMQVHRDIMDGRYQARAVRRQPPATAWVSPEARVEEGAIIEGPCFIDEGAVVKAGARIGPYSVIGRQCHIEEHAVVDGVDRLGRTAASARKRSSARSILGRHCHIGRNAIVDDGVVLGDKSVVTDYSRLYDASQLHATINPTSSRPTTSAALYPGEVNEDARARDRRGVRRLSRSAKRIAVGARHAAVVAVARRGVHRRRARAGRRRRRLRDDGDRHAVLRGRARRPRRRRRRSPRRTIPKQYNGMKMVRREAFPLSGEAGISRHPRHDRRRHAAAAGGAARARVTTKDVLDAYVEHVMSFIDPSVIKPFNVVLDAGSGMGGLVAPKLFERLPCRTTRLCFEIDGTLPESRSQPAHRGEPPRHRRARRRGEGRHRHRLGRRRRPLLLHRRHRRVHLRRFHHGAARRGVPAEASRRDGHLRPARQLRGQGHRSRSTAARR